MQQDQFILTHHHPAWNPRPNGWSRQALVIVVQLPSHVQLFATPWTAACQASLSLTISWSLPKFMSIESMVPSSHLILWHPLLLLPSTFPTSGTFQWVVCSHQITKILELQLQHQSFQWIFRVNLPEDRLVWSPCCPRDFQESSLAPQLEGMNSLAFCLLYHPAVTMVRDHWEAHSLDYIDFC